MIRLAKLISAVGVIGCAIGRALARGASRAPWLVFGTLGFGIVRLVLLLADVLRGVNPCPLLS